MVYGIPYPDRKLLRRLEFSLSRRGKNTREGETANFLERETHHNKTTDTETHPAERKKQTHRDREKRYASSVISHQPSSNPYHSTSPGSHNIKPWKFYYTRKASHSRSVPIFSLPPTMAQTVSALKPYLDAVKSTLFAAVCIRNFPSQIVERHNKPEVEIR